MDKPSKFSKDEVNVMIWEMRLMIEEIKGKIEKLPTKTELYMHRAAIGGLYSALFAWVIRTLS